MLSRLQISALDLRLSIMAGVLVVMALVFHHGQLPDAGESLQHRAATAVVGIVAAAIALIIVAARSTCRSVRCWASLAY
jgi:D-xylose transport system permease protein